MKDILKKKTIMYYIGLATAPIAIAAAIFYMAYTISYAVFIPAVATYLFLGAVLIIATLFLEFLKIRSFSFVYQLVPALCVMFYSLAFGTLLADRLGMIGDYINGIALTRSGKLGDYVIMMVLMIISILAGVVSCFGKQRKAEKPA